MKKWTEYIKWFSLGLGLVMIGAVIGSNYPQPQPKDALTTLTPKAMAATEDAYGMNVFAKIAKEETPAVVNISTKQKVKSRLHSNMMDDERLRDFYEKFYPFFRDMPKEQTRQSLGSGFIVEQDGYILTNGHVVEQADEILVTFGDGANGGEKDYPAKLIGVDKKTDIALIKITTDKKLPVVKLGDSDALQVGEWVIAIGNPFGFSQSVTVGVVSAKGRVIGAGPYDDFIQTDASINPGNSGGPLLNTKGEAIGINTAIFTGGMSGGNIGIGFAVPINGVKSIYQELKKGKVSRGWLGVMIQKITPDLQSALGLASAKGALVGDVTPNSPAEKAGIRRGDVIVEFNGEAVMSNEHLPKMVASIKPGANANVKVLRNREEKVFTLQLGELPEDPDQESGETAPGKSEDEIGMSVENISPELARRLDLDAKSGVVVSGVIPGSPAATAGIRSGDVIAEINSNPVKNAAGYNEAVANVKPGDSVLALVRRGKSTIFIAIKIPVESKK